MSKVTENFEALLKEKQVPYQHSQIEDGHHLYQFLFQIQKSRNTQVELIIQESDEAYVDAQIIYRHVLQLDDRAKEGRALAKINELNEMKTGYYHLYLAGDGEIFLKSLLRLGEDPQPFYQTIVAGSGIVRAFLPELEEALQ